MLAFTSDCTAIEFIHYTAYAIFGEDDLKLSPMPWETCESLCKNHPELCNSYDWIPSDNLCRLSRSDQYNATLVSVGGITYGEWCKGKQTHFMYCWQILKSIVTANNISTK